MTQNELKAWITNDMENRGYKLVPPFDFEVLDCREYPEEKLLGYYQNLTKRALELEFDKIMKSSIQN
jgi:hypothetical protein